MNENSRISDLVQQHALTIKNGAMVCTGGDWPAELVKMPESLDPWAVERIEYAVLHTKGHEKHVAALLDAAQARTWKAGWLTGNRWAFSESDADAIETNPYEET